MIAELVVDGRFTIPFHSVVIHGGKFHLSGGITIDTARRSRAGLTGRLPVVLYGDDEEPVQAYVKDVTGWGLNTMHKGSTATFEYDLHLDKITAGEDFGIRSPRSEPPFISGVTG